LKPAFSLWQYDLQVNTSLISLMPIQGKNAAKHTVVYAVHDMSQQLALPGIAGEAAIRPLAGQRRFSVRQCTDPNGALADSLDEAKAAFRAAGDRQ